MTNHDLVFFVSHVSENRATALEIVEELECRGARCWIAPRDVHPGTPYHDEIGATFEASRATLRVSSDLCNDREYIRREIAVSRYPRSNTSATTGAARSQRYLIVGLDQRQSGAHSAPD